MVIILPLSLTANAAKSPWRKLSNKEFHEKSRDAQTSFALGFANFHLVDYWNLEESKETDLHWNYHYVTKEHGSFAVLSISVFTTIFSLLLRPKWCIPPLAVLSLTNITVAFLWGSFRCKQVETLFQSKLSHQGLREANRKWSWYPFLEWWVTNLSQLKLLHLERWPQITNLGHHDMEVTLNWKTKRYE